MFLALLPLLDKINDEIKKVAAPVLALDQDLFNALFDIFKIYEQ